MKIINSYLEIVCLCFLLLWRQSTGQEELKRPTFPDVFQTEIQGIFMNTKAEMDGSIYYDSKNNRAAMFYMYQNDFTRSIYDFNTNQMIYMEGVECSVTEIPGNSDATFFPFNYEKGRKVIKKAEDVFFFTNSTLDRQDNAVFPSYIYTAKIDIPQYGRKNCEVTHIFSKPEEEIPTCEGHACQSTIVAISVKCEKSGDLDEVDHTYNFFRFRSGISDQSVFQPPPGVHCEVEGTNPFPIFPTYFSFTFDVTEKQEDPDAAQNAFSTHKELWYDAEFNLVRVNEFDDDGLLISSRIFDLNGKGAFTIVATIPTCDMGPISSRIELDEITRLPRIFFSQNSSQQDTAIYVGKRNVHRLDYDVWSLTWTDEETDAMIVEEIFFIKISPNLGLSSKDDDDKYYMRVSHADIYTYQINDQTRKFELSLVTHISVSNFQSKPKDWSAFDVASCFNSTSRKDFLMVVKGPAIIKGSELYQEFMELLYRKLLEVTKISVLRLNELTGYFDGIFLTAFKGAILDNSEASGWPTKTSEPGMDEAFKLMKDAVQAGNFVITLNKEKDPTNLRKYVVKLVEIDEKVEKVKVPSKDCFSGATMAAASIVLLLIGLTFGVVGYYVFLKRRKPPLMDKVQLHPVDLSR